MYRYCFFAIFALSFLSVKANAQKAKTAKPKTTKTNTQQQATKAAIHYKPLDGLGMFKIGVYTEAQLQYMDNHSLAPGAPTHIDKYGSEVHDVLVLKEEKRKEYDDDGDYWEQFILEMKDDSMKISVYGVSYYDLGMKQALLYFNNGKLFRIWMREPTDTALSAFRFVYGPSDEKEFKPGKTRCAYAIKKKIKPGRDIYTWINAQPEADTSSPIVGEFTFSLKIADDCEVESRYFLEIYDLNTMSKILAIKNDLAAAPVEIEETHYQKMIREMSK